MAQKMFRMMLILAASLWGTKGRLMIHQQACGKQKRFFPNDNEVEGIHALQICIAVFLNLLIH